MLIGEFGGRALQPGETLHAADRRHEIAAPGASKPYSADKVAALQRHPGQQQAGVDRVIEPRDAVDRLAHEIAGIERQDDLMIALGAELLATSSCDGARNASSR